jgi:hypothetical protein
MHETVTASYIGFMYVELIWRTVNGNPLYIIVAAILKLFIHS